MFEDRSRAARARSSCGAQAFGDFTELGVLFQVALSYSTNIPGEIQAARNAWTMRGIINGDGVDLVRCVCVRIMFVGMGVILNIFPTKPSSQS